MSSKKASPLSWLYSATFFSLALTICLTIANLKIQSLLYWLYPGDVFLVEQILTETLKGNFGLEFAFGKFGCHYFFFLLFLLPFKLMLGNHMVIFLILLPVISYFFTSCIVFYTLQKQTRNVLLSFLASLLFLLTPNILRGLYSYYHGTLLVDDLSGYIAVLFVLFLVVYQKNKLPKFYALFTIFYVLFLTLSEEFVLFGSIFFFITTCWYKEKSHFMFFILSLIVFVLELIFRDKFFIPLNWDMFNLGVRSLLLFLDYNKHIAFLRSLPVSLIIEYAGTIIGITIIFLYLVIKRRSINVLIAGLFVVGILKCGLGYILRDLDVRSWHNFPGIIMMTGAVSLQIAEYTSSKKIPYGFISAVLGIFVICFAFGDIPYLVNKSREIEIRKDYVHKKQNDLINILALIDPEKLGIVPDETRIECILSGYSRFMLVRKNKLRLDSPPAIVDYILLPIEGSEQLFTNLKNIGTASIETVDFGDISNDFTLIAQNKHYLLYKRTHISEQDKIQRNYVFDLMGISPAD